MSSINLTTCQLSFSPLRRGFQAHKRLSRRISAAKIPKFSLRLASNTSGYRKVSPTCLFGGKGDSKPPPWKALENVLGNFNKRENSVEDLLKQQIKKQEYYDDGSGKPPTGDGGGGGGGSDEADEEGNWEEFGQVMLATIGFIFMYIYIIQTEEVNVLVKDLIKFLFTRQKSLRLERLVSDWQSFWEKMNVEEDDDPYWLERAIINTPTMYDSPEKYLQIIKNAYEEAKSSDEGDGSFE